MKLSTNKEPRYKHKKTSSIEGVFLCLENNLLEEVTKLFHSNTFKFICK